MRAPRFPLPLDTVRAIQRRLQTGMAVAAIARELRISPDVIFRVRGSVHPALRRAKLRCRECGAALHAPPCLACQLRRRGKSRP